VDESRMDDMNAMSQPGQDKKNDWQEWKSVMLAAVVAWGSVYTDTYVCVNIMYTHSWHVMSHS
jgi:hypothetical protein